MERNRRKGTNKSAKGPTNYPTTFRRVLVIDMSASAGDDCTPQNTSRYFCHVKFWYTGGRGSNGEMCFLKFENTSDARKELSEKY